MKQLRVIDSELWVFGKEDLYRVDKSGGIETILSNSRVEDIVLHADALYAVTTDGLLRKAANSGFQEIDIPVNISTDTPIQINAIASYFGHLWLGTNTGLYALKAGESAERIPIPNQDDLWILDLEPAEELWIASRQGAFRLSVQPSDHSEPGWQISPVRFPSGQVGTRKISIIGSNIWLTSLNNFYFGRAGNPYQIVDGIAAFSPPGAIDWATASISQAERNEILFSTRRGVRILEETGRVRFISTPKPVRHAFEWNENIWAGTTGGLFRNHWSCSTPARSPAGSLLHVNDSAVFDDTLWVAADEGLFRLEQTVTLWGRPLGSLVKFQNRVKFKAKYIDPAGKSRLSSDSLEICGTAPGRAKADLAFREKPHCTSQSETSWDVNHGYSVGTFTVMDNYGNSSSMLSFRVVVLSNWWLCIPSVALLLIGLKFSTFPWKKSTG